RTDNKLLFASRNGPRKGASLAGGNKDRTIVANPHPEPDFVAMADELTEKNEFGKAAELLFRDQAPQPVVRTEPPGNRIKRLNNAVANLSERVLKTIPPGEMDAKLPEIAPAAMVAMKGTETQVAFSAGGKAVPEEILSRSVPYLVEGIKQQDDRDLQ